MTHINPYWYQKSVSRLREFFVSRGFIELHTQSQLSTLCACDDLDAAVTTTIGGNVWPLPQSGQVWLERELLSNPDVKGYFALTTSYRDEQAAIPGRHENIFPLFEFEMRGTLAQAEDLQRELLSVLGFESKRNFTYMNYNDALYSAGVKTLDATTERRLGKEHGSVLAIRHYPFDAQTLWNTKVVDGCEQRTGYLLYGMETMSLVEKASDPRDAWTMFYGLDEGQFAERMFRTYGRERVEAELQELLSYDYFPRVSGGIGVSRLVRALKLEETALRRSENEEAAGLYSTTPTTLPTRTTSRITS